MVDEYGRLVELADEMLADARLLLAEGRRRSAVNRAYYATFDAASAVLRKLGSSPRTHAGVLSEFGQKVVKDGLTEKGSAKILRRLFELRQECDYDEYYEVAPDEASEAVEQASEFVERVKTIIKK